MAKQKGTRAGGKYTGSHTTVIPAAGEIADMLSTHTGVTKIALGYIKAGLPSAKGRRRLKISRDGHSLLFAIRDNTTHQELHVYGPALEALAEDVRKRAIQAGYDVVVPEAR